MQFVKWVVVITGFFLFSGCDRIDSMVPKTGDQAAAQGSREPASPDDPGTSTRK
ncbi:hypothetical protein [Herbaspirillum seropedicae]|uniref:hypothetical protein n=1 Tax=Herbaspirillum seropedicae TaxID=964 RepID=UPI00286699DA|nr:hypothetical protein [Herbaspirillum seropedicae]MDR6394248.1 hypothetical protein [Herbaspirillum seropedicae]